MTSDKPAGNIVKKSLGMVTPVILTVIFLLIAFRNVDLDQTLHLVSQAPVKWIILFIFMFFVSHLVRAFRWKLMLHSVKENISIYNLFNAIIIGYGVNCVVPRLGEVYRAFFLGKWENLSRTSMLGTVIVERIIDILALALSVLVSVLIYDGNLLRQIEWLQSTLYIVSILLFTVILFLLVLVFFRERVSQFIFTITQKFTSKGAEKLKYLFEMLTEGFSTIRSRRSLAGIVLLSGIIMLIYGINSYIGLLMLGMEEIQQVSLGTGWVVMTIAAFGIVIPTPGGTGSYHVITKLTLITLYGFSENISFAYAFLTHIIAYILFVFSTLFIVYWSNKKALREGKDKLNFISVFKNGSVSK